MKIVHAKTIRFKLALAGFCCMIPCLCSLLKVMLMRNFCSTYRKIATLFLMKDLLHLYSKHKRSSYGEFSLYNIFL